MKVFAANWLHAALLACLSIGVFAQSLAGNPNQFIVKEKTAPLQNIVRFLWILLRRENTLTGTGNMGRAFVICSWPKDHVFQWRVPPL